MASTAQYTIRFDMTKAEQAKAVAIYEALLVEHRSAKSLGQLFPEVLTVFAEQAREHPALSNPTSRLIAKHQDKVMALLRALEAGQEIPGLEAIVEQQPRPTSQPSAIAAADIEVDFSQL